MGITPYEQLANAIVEQAAKDWRDAVNRLGKDASNRRAQAIRLETESFFVSDWFKALTGLDGRALLTKLKEEFA